MKSISSRSMAKSWPYTRCKNFEKDLRETAKNWFVDQGSSIHSKMNYCLATKDLWEQNIICEEVVDYIKQERQRSLGKDFFPLHKYIHHGLSSQAMTFNLIGPLVVRNDIDILKSSFEEIGIGWPAGKIETFFEHDDPKVFNEDVGQPTSIDVVISGESEGIFIEVKLVEKGFGGCSVFASGDCEGRNPYLDDLSNCYLHHIGRKYWVHLEALGLTKSMIFQGVLCPFANYYQFFREIMFAFVKKGSFVLLHDERNPAFLRSANNSHSGAGLWPFLEECIPPDLRHRVGRVSIQTIVQAVESSGRHNDWIFSFKKKYGIQ